MSITIKPTVYLAACLREIMQKIVNQDW